MYTTNGPKTRKGNGWARADFPLASSTLPLKTSRHKWEGCYRGLVLKSCYYKPWNKVSEFQFLISRKNLMLFNIILFKFQYWILKFMLNVFNKTSDGFLEEKSVQSVDIPCRQNSSNYKTELKLCAVELSFLTFCLMATVSRVKS